MSEAIIVIVCGVVGVLACSRWGVSLRRGVYRRRNHSKNHSNRHRG